MKRATALVTIVVCLGLLCSCVTAGAVFRSNFEGRPVWYYLPENQVKKGRTVFLGEGRATNERQARLLAFANLFENIEFYFGSQLSEEYYRELSVMQTIEDFDLSVTDSDVSLENGAYTVLLRATASTEIVEKLRTDGALSRQETLDKINELVSQGVEFMKSGQDLSAAKQYMQAMVLAWNNPDVKEPYTFDSLLEECHRIINSVSLYVSDRNMAKATCLVTANLTEGKINTVVSSCPVVATYKAIGVNGERYEDSFFYNTDMSGSFEFSPMNYSMERTGIVIFSLDIEKYIEELENTAGKEAVLQLRKDFESKKAYFGYSLNYTNKTVGLVIMDFDIAGEEIGNSLSGDYFKEKFSKAGIKFTEVSYSSTLENGEILESYRNEIKEPGYLFISRIAETDSIKSETGAFVVSCEGSFSIYDTNSDEPLKGSEMIYSTAFGDSQEQAEQEAFNNLADMIFSFIRSVYV